jgi:uncharacterized protein
VEEARGDAGLTVGERIAAASNRFYLRIRDKHAWDPVDGEPGAADFAALEGHKYALIVTYRQTGEGIPTPVWFGLDGGKLYFRSEASVGKVKRIRANGRARVAPCDARGKPKGPVTEARARILPPDEEPVAEEALKNNYGLGRKLYEGVAMNIGPAGVYVEVSPA